MKRIRRFFAIFLVNIVVLAVCVETLGLLFYAQQTGSFFYAHIGSAAKATSTDTPTQIAEAVFHPFFGYINRVGRSADDWTTNNHGFQFVRKYYRGSDSCCDYPYIKRDGETVIGVFGGSVADGFALDAQRFTSFADALTKFPAFANKKIRILNYSMPGWMQPHQLIALSYYIALGQKFDAVVEIDGFNEVVSIERNWRSGVEPTFPANVIWGEWAHTLEMRTRNFQSMNSLEIEYHNRSSLNWLRNAETCKTATCWLISKALARYHYALQGHATRLASQDKLSARTLFPTNRMSPKLSEAEIYSFIADRWVDSSAAMAALTKAQGSLYLHVLQPNQWFKRAGDYTPINPAHQYQFVIEPVNRGYEEMLSRIPALISKGIDFLDATSVFTGKPNREVFIDDCCHYTHHGNELLAHLIAGSLGAASNRNSPRP